MAVDYTFGLPGGYAAVNPIVSTTRGFIAKEAVTAGCFCWEDSTNAGQVNPSGSGVPLGTVVAYTNAVPDGPGA